MKLELGRCLIAGTIAAVVATAQPALAETTVGQPEVVTYRTSSTVELPRFQTAPQPQTPSARTMTRMAMYVAQAIDAAQSGRAFGQGRREANPMMRPFSHAGTLGMAVGFALGDAVRGAMLRRSSDKVKIAADTAQAASNLEGIMATRVAMSVGKLP